MSDKNTKALQPENQQDFNKHEPTSSSLDNGVEALKNQPRGPDDSSQDTSAQTCHPHQANVLPSSSPISAETQPQQHFDPSLPPAVECEPEREQVAENMLASTKRQDHTMDDTPILSQGQPISSKQPSFGNTGLKNESESSKTPRAHRPYWKVWWQEILCLLSSIASLIAIVIVLVSYDNHTLPTWPLGITLNTLLAFFTTLAKGAFMLPVSTALSQSKFAWFLEPKPLHDFHILDQASRGWWGFMTLLYRVRFKHTVTIGATLMIVSILSSPVTQLAIKYPTRNDITPDGKAKIFAINEISLIQEDLRRLADRASVRASVPDTGDFSVQTPPQKALCSTGNCDFSPYQSLGVCVDFANITSHLQTKLISNLAPEDQDGDIRLTTGRKTWHVSLSSQYSLLHQNPLSLKSGVLNGIDSFGFTNNKSLLKTKIASFFLIYTSPSPPNNTQSIPSTPNVDDRVLYRVKDFGYEAREVLFHICVQRFETKVSNGTEETRVTDTVSHLDDAGKGFILESNCTSTEALFGCRLKKSPGNLIAHFKAPNSESRVFSVPYLSMWYMAQSLFQSFSGVAEMRIWDGQPTTELWFNGLTRIFFDDVLYTNQNIFNSTRREAHLDNFYRHIATSLSSSLRTAHHQAKRPGAVLVEGKPLKQVSYVHVRWAWMSFLVVEVAAATLFLIIVITAHSATSREHEQEGAYVPADVKDSALATLVVLSNECREVLSDGLQPAGVLKKTSKKLQVTLQGNKLELASDPELQSSHSGVNSPQEIPTGEHGLPKKRFPGRILMSKRP